MEAFLRCIVYNIEKHKKELTERMFKKVQKDVIISEFVILMKIKQKQ